MIRKLLWLFENCSSINKILDLMFRTLGYFDKFLLVSNKSKNKQNSRLSKHQNLWYQRMA